MNSTLKTILIGGSFFILGAATLFFIQQYTAMQKENTLLKSMSSISPTISQKPVNPPQENLSPTPTKKAEDTGSAGGIVSYPGEGIPPLEVFAINTSDPSIYFSVKTAENQGTFTIDGITPGTYTFFAYVQGDDSLVGGYSNAVACGLTVECTDHTLVKVAVETNKKSSGIEVKDWYAPEGTFPKHPTN